MNKLLHVVLVRPQIPSNTGSIGRTCLNYDAKLHLVGPLGFSLDSSRVKRAGLDYWPHVDLSVYKNWMDFEEQNKILQSRFFFSKFGKQSLIDTVLLPKPAISPPNITLVFGSETSGLFDLLGEDTMKGHPIIKLPMLTSRRTIDLPSFNLASCVAMVMWEAWRQHAQQNKLE